MKVVLDTNVIIAAFAANGICQALIEACIDQHQILINEHILSEVREKLHQKLKVPHGTIQAIIDYLREHAQVVQHGKPSTPVCRDPDDDWVLALGQVGGAEYIVTGDQDLLSLGSYSGVAIATPREFWEALRRGLQRPDSGRN